MAEPVAQAQVKVVGIGLPSMQNTKYGPKAVADMVDESGTEWAVWGEDKIRTLQGLQGQLVTITYFMGRNGKPQVQSVGNVIGTGQVPQIPQQMPTVPMVPQPPMQQPPPSPAVVQSNLEQERRAHISRCTALKCAVKVFAHLDGDQQTLPYLLQIAEVQRRWLQGEPTGLSSSSPPEPAPAPHSEPAPVGQTDDIPF